MIWLESLIGLVLVILSAGLIFVFSLPRLWKSRRVLRPIPALIRLRRAIGLAVVYGAARWLTWLSDPASHGRFW